MRVRLQPAVSAAVRMSVWRTATLRSSSRRAVSAPRSKSGRRSPCRRLRMLDLPLYAGACDGFIRRGRVTAVGRQGLELRMPPLHHGSVVAVTRSDASVAFAEVRSIGQRTLCTPLTSVQGIAIGAPAYAANLALGAYVGAPLLGQVVDAWGRPAEPCAVQVAPRSRQIPLADRRPVTRPLVSGIVAIDAFCTLGAGQRIALFAGPGVGKSTLLRQMASAIRCDVHVLALIGERAREASETIEYVRATARS